MCEAGYVTLRMTFGTRVGGNLIYIESPSTYLMLGIRRKNEFLTGTSWREKKKAKTLPQLPWQCLRSKRVEAKTVSFGLLN